MLHSTASVCPACQTGSVPAQLPHAQLCPSCAVIPWAADEPPFAANTYCGVDPAGSVRTVLGARDVIFSASSAVNYYRGDMRLPAARYAGSLALTMARVAGQTALAASGPAAVLPVRETPEASYAQALRDIVRPESLVIDLRGMRERSFDVCVGTGPMPDDRAHAIVAALTRVCEPRGLKVEVNQPFGALPTWTVAHFAQTQLGVSAVQVQLAASLRDPVNSPMLAQITLVALRAATLAGLQHA